jgi:hypothetical protein
MSTDSEFLEHIERLAKSHPPPLHIRLNGADADRLLQLATNNRDTRRRGSTPQQFTRRELLNCIKVINEGAAARVAHQLVHGKPPDTRAPRPKLDIYAGAKLVDEYRRAYPSMKNAYVRWVLDK